MSKDVLRVPGVFFWLNISSSSALTSLAVQVIKSTAEFTMDCAGLSDPQQLFQRRQRPVSVGKFLDIPVATL